MKLKNVAIVAAALALAGAIMPAAALFHRCFLFWHPHRIQRGCKL